MDVQDADQRARIAADVDSELELLETSQQKLWVRHAKVQGDLQLSTQRADVIAERAFRAADKALVDAGLLAEPEEPEEDNYTVHEEQERSSSPTKANRHFTEQLPETQREVPAHDLLHDTPDMRQIVQNGRQRELRDARRAWSEASKDFRRVRKEYDGKLADFLESKEKGSVVGTKTDFDAGYYIARKELTHKLVLAEDRFERAKNTAQQVGVLPLNEQTSDFAHHLDDGYASAEVEAYMETTDKDWIERWRQDEAQGQIELDEGRWTVEEVSQDADARTIGPGSSVSQDRYDIGKRKKLIDRWKTQQEDSRSSSNRFRASYKRYLKLRNGAARGGGCHYPLLS